MKVFMIIFALLLAGSKAFAQDSIDQQIAQIQQKTEALQQRLSAPPKSPPAWLSYVDAVEQSRTSGKPFVIFAGVQPRAVEGMIVAQQQEPSVRTGAPAIAVSWDGRRLVYLSINASDSDIRQAAGLEQSRLALPFLRRRGELPPRTADADSQGRGLWPRTLDWIKGTRRYQPARNTQMVFNRTITEPTPRANLENKWIVPGGMDGIQGWRSDLYRYVPSAPVVQLGRIDVWNGGFWTWGGGGIVYENGQPKKSMQAETGYLRSYPDGTFFVDVLSSESGIFEARVREKNAGRWESYVAFKDVAARPDGYTGLKQSCQSCHNEAGSGGYATGLVPGGDTVLSDPFSELERQN